MKNWVRLAKPLQVYCYVNADLTMYIIKDPFNSTVHAWFSVNKTFVLLKGNFTVENKLHGGYLKNVK